MCTDHGGDGFSMDDQVSAITGRDAYISHTDQYRDEFGIDYLKRMKTIIGFYDIRGSGDEEAWKLQTAFNQFIVCADFPWQTRVFRVLGFSQEHIDALIGCPREAMETRWAFVQEAINHPTPDAEAFKNVCPYVVIPDQTKPYWHLPGNYMETRVMEGVSVWSVR
jgi:hypothetical protein